MFLPQKLFRFDINSTFASNYQAMIFRANTKMAEVVLSNHHLLSVMSRFGIKLGFGDKSVKEVCAEHGVDHNFFLEIVNAFNERDYLPGNHLGSFSLRLIISYLKKTHDYYINRKLPEISILIEDLISGSTSSSKELGLIRSFFNDYFKHFKEHIEREETIVYPYIISLEEYFNDPKCKAEAEIAELRSYAIERYEKEHDDVEASLFDLKSLIIKYLPPQENYILCYKILGQLGHLENDINDHTHMENRVLIPRVTNMEKFLK